MFSIIIPSFNRKLDLLECLNRLNLQSYNDFEVVIIDDFSDISVDEYVFSDDYKFMITIIRNDGNKGAAVSRNKGVSNSKYDWIMFLDDDDVFLNNKCEILNKYIDSNDAKFYYHPAIINMISEDISYETNPETTPNKITETSMLKSNQIGGTPMWCISKDLFLELGGFNNYLKALEDYEFILRMLKNIKKSDLYYIDIPLTQCNYLTKRSSVSKNIQNTKKALNYLERQFYSGHEMIFKKYYNEHMAHSYLMSLSRISALFYLKSALYTMDITSLIKAILILISPSMSIKLRKYL